MEITLNRYTDTVYYIICGNTRYKLALRIPSSSPTASTTPFSTGLFIVMWVGGGGGRRDIAAKTRNIIIRVEKSSRANTE